MDDGSLEFIKTKLYKQGIRLQTLISVDELDKKYDDVKLLFLAFSNPKDIIGIFNIHDIEDSNIPTTYDDIISLIKKKTQKGMLSIITVPNKNKDVNIRRLLFVFTKESENVMQCILERYNEYIIVG